MQKKGLWREGLKTKKPVNHRIYELLFCVDVVSVGAAG